MVASKEEVADDEYVVLLVVEIWEELAADVEEVAVVANLVEVMLRNLMPVAAAAAAAVVEDLALAVLANLVELMLGNLAARAAATVVEDLALAVLANLVVMVGNLVERAAATVVDKLASASVSAHYRASYLLLGLLVVGVFGTNAY